MSGLFPMNLNSFVLCMSFSFKCAVAGIGREDAIIVFPKCSDGNQCLVYLSGCENGILWKWLYWGLPEFWVYLGCCPRRFNCWEDESYMMC